MSGTLIKGRGNAPIPQMGTKKACAKNCVWTLIEFSNRPCFELRTMQSPYLPLPQTKIPLHTLRIHRLTSPSSFIIQVRCSLRIPSCVKERVWDITTTTKQFREKILHGCGRAWYCLG